ncbi:hypothetical protein DICPUDRAFT_90215 [Dictyostelium purpureum]|uniref:U6 snRNA-associated Sm-like protein LSm8 n=1 Tax=Dictyostelium purpureum TaxID=5786 RepID=F1A138_DICPU|nr:uncharacterized protein DICPUDRAFT_90215 [Dictyostelium purpureum]EGC30091.1 hypothetical protein DICPUDRAFT_90215 [Dictyostelium purpureum]|eukprot:XP_003293378.1 hypothetical protein DICPUDRAFT_90215 [Dictyostelium purpureum]
MALLEPFLKKKVLVLTADGRNIIGILRGTDQTTNVILEKCEERVFSDEGIEVIPLGVHLIKGDDVAVIGEVDEELDRNLNLKETIAEPLKPIVH